MGSRGQTGPERRSSTSSSGAMHHEVLCLRVVGIRHQRVLSARCYARPFAVWILDRVDKLCSLERKTRKHSTAVLSRPEYPTIIGASKRTFISIFTMISLPYWSSLQGDLCARYLACVLFGGPHISRQLHWADERQCGRADAAANSSASMGHGGVRLPESLKSVL